MELAAVAAALRGPPAKARLAPNRKVAVVVPAFRDAAMTLACLAAVFATVPAGTPVLVVDDASPEPALAEALDELHRQRRIRLLRHPQNLGFPAAANTGLRAGAHLPGRPDLVLLNSDALVTPGWLERLRRAVHAAPDIGTATPLSNDATIMSYPDPALPEAAPDGARLAALARLAGRTLDGVAVDLPTAIGFCMYIRRECLAETGVFRPEIFAQGYGEENDFCLRARHLGWRHVGVPGAYVAHLGGRSFGAAKSPLLARNLALLEQLHPGYRRLVTDFQRADPMAAPRRLLDIARWKMGRVKAGAVLLVSHDSGGGVERALRERITAVRQAGQRAVVLRPVLARDGETADRRYRPGLCVLGDGAEGGFPNLRFQLPQELDALARLLRADRPVALEVHHLLGHGHAVTALAARLDIPTDFHVHDYAAFCPRITLIGPGVRYCGEPESAAVCDACVADCGSAIEEEIGVAELRARSAWDFAAARRIGVPSEDVAARLRRHFPGIAPEVVPLESDARLPRLVRQPARPRRLVCVIGAIGPVKGYDVLLDCARDAAWRDLALEFVLAGHSPDDARLLATGRIAVTGPYREAEAEALVRGLGADLCLLPSIWPETWCYTLGTAWRAGLRVAAFDIGAPAERIRRTGRGWLLPLGLPAAAINNALLAVNLATGDV
jgi:GT2 family glycosyltransferase